MSTMIERVAKAICRSGALCCENAPQMSCYATSHLEAARAAIEALRNPTPAMFDAGCDVCDARCGLGGQANNIFNAMIDAALSGDA